MTLFLRNNIWHVYIRLGRKRRVRASTGTSNRTEAETEAAKLLAKYKGVDTWREFVVADDALILAYLAKALERARKRDRVRGRVCEMTPQDMRSLYARSEGRCEVTGIPFSLDKAGGTFRRPFAPSVDRLDNSKPYSFVNCRLVCLAVNIGINEWGEGVFRRIAKGFLAERIRRPQIQPHASTGEVVQAHVSALETPR